MTTDQSSALLQEKITRLRNAWVVETNPATKFQLEQQLKEAERDLETIMGPLPPSDLSPSQSTSYLPLPTPSPPQPIHPNPFNLRLWVLKILRDPMWQAIGVLVAIFGLVLAIQPLSPSNNQSATVTPTSTEQATVNPTSFVTPVENGGPTSEPFVIQYISFEPLSASVGENVKIFACTGGFGGVGITLKVSINNATDGSDTGEWQVLKELGVPCFNQEDAPVWDTSSWPAGTYLIKVEAKGPDDPFWEHSLVQTSTYTLKP